MQADFTQLWRFNGGLKLPGHKQGSTQGPLQTLPIPARLILPLQQHIGEAAEPVVRVGDYVHTGDTIARATGYVSVDLHASSSGTVVDVGPQAVPHPSGLSAACIVIETDGADRRRPARNATDQDNAYRSWDPSALRNRIREAGIVGLGGAGFPSFIKLNPHGGRRIDRLILNGAECEPYITCDDMLMRERPEEILLGAAIMLHALQAERCIIGVEDNKPEAYEALRAVRERRRFDDIDICLVPTIFPTGGEKQLIKVLTGREVPSNGLPHDIGLVCHNVGTAAAVHAAITADQPLISRIVTVTGAGVAQSQNWEVRLGTPVADLIAAAGGYTAAARRLIMGGPMMGFTLHSDAVPLTKTSNCILVTGADEAPAPQAALPCIRCGACAEACPANLLPQQLYWYARARDFDKVQDYHLFDCIECGCCAYVCPSHIPLVQYYRFAKTEIWSAERDKQKSDLARQRHEFRLERLERQKAERAERLRKRKEALRQTGDTPAEDPKKAAIEAALARVREKQAQQPVTKRNVDQLTDTQRQQIAEVEARRRRAGPSAAPGPDSKPES